jgi:hypothetical protein
MIFMIKYISLILILTLKISNINCQSSFSVLISSSDDERIFDATEDSHGNYYLVGKKFTPDTLSKHAFFLALNSTGQIIYEHDYLISDSVSFFGNVYSRNDSIFIIGGKGPQSLGLSNKVWFLVLNSSYDIVVDRTYYLDGRSITDGDYIINNSGNFVLTGVVSSPISSQWPDLLLYEISSVGDSIRRSFLSYDGAQIECDLLELDNGGYKIFALGTFPGAPQSLGTIVTVDSSFNFLDADSIPFRLYFNHSAKWIDDTSYLVTGNKNIYNPSYRTDLGIVRLNEADDLIVGNHFGKSGDTVSYVGACSNLDFIDLESIFFGGASNIFPSHLMYQPEDSWLILNNIDSDLNLNWQRFYGGDACYYLWGLKATQDGGCLMLATRYDEMTQFQELDVFILKVDSNGLLTSTGEAPHIPSNELILYPNPARSQITVRYPDIFNHREREIIIWNALGTAVRRLYRPPGQAEEPIDISNLPPGFYIAVLHANGEKIAVGKFVVH